jgi:hypothetical protein
MPFVSTCKYVIMFLGVDFLKEIQVHYDINLELEMLIEKF